jgi:hypothetical protein
MAMKGSIIMIVGMIAIGVAAVVGEVMCIVKAINCNWEPVGKAEIVYTGAALVGLGAVVGYMDIQDK